MWPDIKPIVPDEVIDELAKNTQDPTDEWKAIRKEVFILEIQRHHERIEKYELKQKIYEIELENGNAHTQL